jgi:hypothetical protein
MQSLFNEVTETPNESFDGFEESKQYAGIALDASNTTAYQKHRPGPMGVPVMQVPVADPKGSTERSLTIDKNYTWDPNTESFVLTDKAPFKSNQISNQQEKPKAPKGKRAKALQDIIETSHEEMVIIPSLKVSLQGVFGKFTGKYVDALVQDKLLVLLQEDSEDGFVPPESEDNTVKVSWIDREGDPQVFEAYYLGLTFTSKVINKTSYIFHLIGA